MDSSSFVYCPNCNEKYKDVFLLSCMHNFCSKCTDLMKNGAETTCLLCSKSFHQDDVKRNTFVEKFNSMREKPEENESTISICEICGLDDNTIQANKYCVECDQYLCEKCSTMHLRSKQCNKHQIVDKNDKNKYIDESLEQFCEKHKLNFTIYCKICDDILCSTCWIKDHSDHAKPENLEENLEKVFAKSSSYVKMKISEIDNIIENQNIIIRKNIDLESDVLKKNKSVRNSIENYATKLKDKIDLIKNAMVLQINLIDNKLIKSVKNDKKEIIDYIDSLSVKQSYYTKIINNKSNMQIFNLKHELSNYNCIEYKQAKEIKTIGVTYKEPSIEKDISSEMLKSFNVDAKEEIFTLSFGANSTCIFNEKIYSHFTSKNDIIIKIYDKNTMSYNTSIEFQPNVTDKIIDVNILNTQHNLFLYYRLENQKNTYLLKFQEYNKTFVELKTFKEYCHISSTYQQTLLVTTNRQIIELSASGDEYNIISLSDTAAGIFSACFTNHQLKNGRYFVTSDAKYYENAVYYELGLLDTEGAFIKNELLFYFGRCTSCTDGEKYIFAYSQSAGIMQVFSIDLQYLHEFKYPIVKSIYYDKQNDKLLLVKEMEITYFNYYLGMLLEKK